MINFIVDRNLLGIHFKLSIDRSDKYSVCFTMVALWSKLNIIYQYVIDELRSNILYFNTLWN